ncbi:hypothetical protein KAR91_07750 [Candidatus Pacearchaeota archaeon]|nr:hypothetical protein [Candidatus Pacearchaeota archaeon]
MDTFTVEDLIKEVRSIIKGKRITTFQQQPFFGRLMFNFQDGHFVHIEKRETYKPETLK